jgi:hypothetical protein
MTKTYEEAMEELNVAAYAALRAALNEDGAPVDALREIAAEIDSLIDHGVTAECRTRAPRCATCWRCTRAQSWRGWCDDGDGQATYSGEELNVTFQAQTERMRLRRAKQPRLVRGQPRQH